MMKNNNLKLDYINMFVLYKKMNYEVKYHNKKYDVIINANKDGIIEIMIYQNGIVKNKFKKNELNKLIVNKDETLYNDYDNLIISIREKLIKVNNAIILSNNIYREMI